jgi:hypothetical protein
MSISFVRTLDEAVKTLMYNKFGAFLNLSNQNKDVVFAPKNIAQRKIAEKRGESSVEFISVWRNSIAFDWERQNSAIGRTGIALNYVDSNTKEQIVTVKAVPVTIDYDIYLWSRDLDKITNATESYLQWLHNVPQLVVYYNGQYEMDMYMKLKEIYDDSDYNIYEKGQYFISKFNMKLDAWVLTTISNYTILKIIVDFYLREGQAPNYHDTLLNEYVINATV